MTPAIRRWASWLGRVNDYDPDYMPHWFDFQGCVNGSNVIYPIQWLPHYRPPFPDTAVVFKSSSTNQEILLLLSGSDPEEGIGFATSVRMHNGDIKKHPPGWYLFKDGTLHINPECADDKTLLENADLSMALAAIFYRTLAESTKPAYLPIVEQKFTDRRDTQKGKPPKYTWHHVVIGKEAILRQDRGGTHASPRQHDRRGHQRRLKSGRAVWVRACKVGDPSKGAVFKDYAVRTLQ